MKHFNLKSLITREFLYYSWIDLKNKEKSFYSSSKVWVLEPLSKAWFEKTSFLIRRGDFIYNQKKISGFNKFFFIRKKLSLRKVKNKIIENAFLILLKPYFSDSSFIKDLNLTECVRLFIR
jgi:hypothetical protein